MNSQKIVILGTGGTIAGKAASASDNIGYTAAQVGVEQLIAAIPALAEADNLLAEQVAQVDSKDMDFAIWAQLARRIAFYLARDDVRGVVITHGTDTLEETAYFLQAVLAPLKPVVLTCAMRPATALVPDGPQNVLDALAVAADPAASGVLAVCAGTVHGALDVQKVHTYQLDAFASGDAGPLAYVEEGRLRWLRRSIEQPARAVADLTRLGDGTGWPQVEIVLNHTGAGGAVVDMLAASGVNGIVVAATGNGTVHRVLEAALLRAQAAGVTVIRATRCLNGRVLARSDDLLPDSEGLTPVKARIAAILRLLQLS
jgi:L-asparaginase